MRLNILLFIFMAFVPVLSGCGKESATAAKIERPALTMTVGAAATDNGNTYSGEVRARHETQLGFRVGGKIVERMVEVGTQVKAGQALMRLDSVDTGLQLSSAEAQYQLARADAERYRELRNKGFVSQSAMDAKEAAQKTASAQAYLARNQHAYTTLYAEHAGVVIATLAEAGQVVSAVQPMLRIAHDGEREVVIAIPESQLASFKVGAIAEVFMLTSSPAPLTGRLRELSPLADPVSRTYAARITLTKPSPDTALGMTARVHFPTNQKLDGMLIPLSAIFQQGKQAAVWIVADDHTVSLRPVQLAAYRDDGAVIATGLAIGERIVSNGVHRLATGERIRIIESHASR